jgi:coenzyme F420 hydrogenase subunit beta
MTKPRNIASVAAELLCNTCGACQGVCPADAIRYRETMGGHYLPVVDETACTGCGLCRAVCPGIHFGETLMARLPADPFAGTVPQAFVGKAADQALYENSQSGGLVSALLAHALETGFIKAAVTVVMPAGRPPRPVVRVARNRRELQQAQKSKNCPVPLLAFLKNLREEDGPVALVGLPCHIHGLYNILDRRPDMRRRIAFTVGLMCDRVQTYAALDYLLDRALPGIDTRANLHFRDKSLGGYPGQVHAFCENGPSKILPAKVRMRIKDYFTPARCRLCFDKMNVFADLTVGDPHGLRGVDRQGGESVLAVRSEIGHGIVQAACAAACMTLRPADYGRVLTGQDIAGKKKQWRDYVEAWDQLGRPLPDYCDRVKMSAANCSGSRKYRKDLAWALNLDRFASREKLLRHVTRALNRQQARKGLLLPLRLVGQLVRRIFR